MQIQLGLHNYLTSNDWQVQEVELPPSITENINPKFALRKYQQTAFKRFIYYNNNKHKAEVFQKPKNHILYNMATGSGKTLIMAGLVSYLHELGYNNFLFFSTSRAIIEKTRDNFLNKSSNKYLYNQNIRIENRLVDIKEVSNFDFSSSSDINIAFTTIQTLYKRIKEPRENQITKDDFKKNKVVLIGDEAHHFNTKTKQKDKDLLNTENWENSIDEIKKQNPDNMLLEFTATLDYDNPFIHEKYTDKVIYKYDLKEFRDDKYSKEIYLLQSDLDKKSLIIQAIILNQYKQNIALDNGISLKPVILFKSNRLVKESLKNSEFFNKIVRELSKEDINKIYENSKKNRGGEIVKKAIEYFQNNGGFDYLIETLKSNFAENKCLNVNESEAKNQLKEVREQEKNYLNNLEEDNNKIRAIFAVDKLNEGWDVLNLFDIVRLYDDNVHSTKSKSSTKKTTVSEAQLIGRGARYCPIDVEFEEKEIDLIEKYQRKFDNTEADLKILEELYYHSIYNSKFIADLQKELVEQGLMDDPSNYEEVNLEVKSQFAGTELYKRGLVLSNAKRKRRYDEVNIWNNITFIEKNFEYKIPSGAIVKNQILEQRDQQNLFDNNTAKAINVLISDIPDNIKYNAILENQFYDFNHLKRYLTKLTSIDDFISNYLNRLEITYRGSQADLLVFRDYQKDLLEKGKSDLEIKSLVNGEIYQSIVIILLEIERQLKKHITPYEGTRKFGVNKDTRKALKSVFVNKTLKIKKGEERLDGQEEFLKGKDWYVYKQNYGTSEEKAFVSFFDTIYDDFKAKGFEDIYLVRNEEALHLYNFSNGDGFCPDFVLFMKKNNENQHYQVFIEPKGEHLIEKDKWKNEFLQEIKDMYKSDDKNVYYEYGNKDYNVLAVRFYNSSLENQTKEELKELDFI